MDSIKNPDDDVIDFGKWFRKKGTSSSDSTFPSPKHPSDDVFSFDAAAIKKHAYWLVPLLIIVFVFSFSFYLRTIPLSIPVADRWADDSVRSYYSNQIADQINRQFPNLPAENKRNLIATELAKFLTQNKALFDQQVTGTADQFREKFKDPTGQPYLLGIDPYYYYRQTRNILQYGNVGTEIRNGEPFDSYKVAPVGASIDSNIHPYLGVIVYKFMSIFSDISIMGSFFYVGALISALSIIPAFFIGRNIGGNVGGFFTAWAIAINSFFLSRTAGESSDTDSYNIFFPLIIAWLFLEAVDSNSLKKRIGLGTLIGLAVGLYAFAWTGWWFILYFMLATLGLLAVFYAIVTFYGKWSSSFPVHSIPNFGIIAISIIISTSIFTILFTNLTFFYKAVRVPFGFLAIKSVGTTKIWPNVLTTVAELNPSSLDSVIGQLGGMFLFVVCIIGIILVLFQRRPDNSFPFHYSLLFGIWLVVSLWATTKGVRFTLLVVPPFAIGFGFFCGFLYRTMLSKVVEMLHVNHSFLRVVLVCLLGLFIITPTQTAFAIAEGSVSAMNDGWWDSLAQIRDNSSTSAIITSWWDFGHWFKAIADRPVTFDGGNQNTPQAYWVGKLLLTSDENVSIGILRMLDCGGNTAFDEVDKQFHNIPQSIKLLNEIITLDRARAASALQRHGFSDNATETILQYTHCQPPEGFVIASDDMIGKAGVWGHFGAWDFVRANMIFDTKKLSQADALAVLRDKFNLSDDAALQIYRDILTEDPNKWIAPWPSYFGGQSSCVVQNTSIQCPIRVDKNDLLLTISIPTLNATFATRDNRSVCPNSITFASSDGVFEKDYRDSCTTIGFSVALIPSGNSYTALTSDPLLDSSIFTRMYFYQGHGFRCFDLFSQRQQINGGIVNVFKVDWDCASVHSGYSNLSSLGPSSDLPPSNKNFDKPRLVVELLNSSNTT